MVLFVAPEREAMSPIREQPQERQREDETERSRRYRERLKDLLEAPHSNSSPAEVSVSGLWWGGSPGCWGKFPTGLPSIWNPGLEPFSRIGTLLLGFFDIGPLPMGGCMACAALAVGFCVVWWALGAIGGNPLRKRRSRFPLPHPPGRGLGVCTGSS
jgi:hypothetical protein